MGDQGTDLDQRLAGCSLGTEWDTETYCSVCHEDCICETASQSGDTEAGERFTVEYTFSEYFGDWIG